MGVKFSECELALPFLVNRPAKNGAVMILGSAMPRQIGDLTLAACSTSHASPKATPL